MKAVGWFLAAGAPVALVWAGAIPVEGCGAMTFELPPEEPTAEPSSPPRLMRHDGGAPEPQPGQEVHP